MPSVKVNGLELVYSGNEDEKHEHVEGVAFMLRGSAAKAFYLV